MRDGKGGCARKLLQQEHKFHRDKYKDKYFVNVNKNTMEVQSKYFES